MMISLFDRVENTVGIGENAGYQHFLLFPQCFLKPFPIESELHGKKLTPSFLFRHFQETHHTYTMELGKNEVWDYVGDNYVHRLVQNKSDGKLVKVDERGNRVQDDKLESLNLEVCCVFHSVNDAKNEIFHKLCEKRRKCWCCVHCRGHIFSQVLMKIGQNLFLADFSEEFEIGLSHFKK